MYWRERWSNLLSSLLAWEAGIMLEIQLHFKKHMKEDFSRNYIFLLALLTFSMALDICVQSCVSFCFTLSSCIILQNRRKLIKSFENHTFHLFNKQTQKLTQNFCFSFKSGQHYCTIASKQPSLFWFRNRWYQPFLGVKKPRNNLRR